MKSTSDKLDDVFYARTKCILVAYHGPDKTAFSAATVCYAR